MSLKAFQQYVVPILLQLVLVLLRGRVMGRHVSAEHLEEDLRSKSPLGAT